jgi:hypothetical protein
MLSNLKQTYQNVAKIGESQPRGQWASFLNATAQEKQVNGYLMYNNVDNTTDIDGLQLHCLKTEELKLSSNISKHYAENGRVINDFSTHDPIEFTLKGHVGDIFVQNKQYRKILNTIFANFGIVNSYLPQKTQSQTKKINELIVSLETLWGRVVGVIDQTQNMLAAFQAINPQNGLVTKTQQVTQFLTFMERNAIPLNVYTQIAGNLSNVIIKEVDYIRELEKSNIIEITIRCQQVGFAESQIVYINKGSYLGRVNTQVGDYEAQTKTQGKVVDPGSIMYNLFQR